ADVATLGLRHPGGEVLEVDRLELGDLRSVVRSDLHRDHLGAIAADTSNEAVDLPKRNAVLRGALLARDRAAGAVGKLSPHRNGDRLGSGGEQRQTAEVDGQIADHVLPPDLAFRAELANRATRTIG